MLTSHAQFSCTIRGVVYGAKKLRWISTSKTCNDGSKEANSENLNISGPSLVLFDEPFRTKPRLFASYMTGLNISRLYLTSKDSFSISNFKTGCYQVFEVVSQNIFHGTFENLDGLVEANLIDRLKNRVDELPSNQRKLLDLTAADVFYLFFQSTQLGYRRNGENNQNYFVDFLVGFHCYYQHQKVQENMLNIVSTSSPVKLLSIIQENQWRMVIANFHLSRQIDPAVEDWVVTKANYFQPVELVKPA